VPGAVGRLCSLAVMRAAHRQPRRVNREPRRATGKVAVPGSGAVVHGARTPGGGHPGMTMMAQRWMGKGPGAGEIPRWTGVTVGGRILAPAGHRETVRVGTCIPAGSSTNMGRKDKDKGNGNASSPGTTCPRDQAQSHRLRNQPNSLTHPLQRFRPRNKHIISNPQVPRILGAFFVSV
jgi:hypothetical protein